MPRNTGGRLRARGAQHRAAASRSSGTCGSLAAAAFVALIAAAIVHTFNYDRDFHIPADEVARTEDARTRLLASHV